MVFPRCLQQTQGCLGSCEIFGHFLRRRLSGGLPPSADQLIRVKKYVVGQFWKGIVGKTAHWIRFDMDYDRIPAETAQLENIGGKSQRKTLDRLFAAGLRAAYQLNLSFSPGD